MSDQPAPKITSTRRSFIKNSSLLAAGAAVGGNLAAGLSVARAAQWSDTIKIGQFVGFDSYKGFAVETRK
jgi:hypothetical protein